jgi:hypothetical protein
MKSGTSTSRWWAPAMLIGCLFTLFLTPGAVAQPQTIVRGKIERQNSPRNYPAPRVRVTLAPANDQGRATTAYTGADGMYYFHNVAAGQYVLKVWNSQDQAVRAYTIVAGRKTYTDIKPIVIP